jgi:purine-cytosine permease-like protein
MKRNVGTGERLLRGAGGAAMATCAVMAPVPMVVRLGVFGVMGAYLLLSALVGTCLGYALIGRSTCSRETQP